ncbi:MAG: carbohydrate deacetylase [Chloroflexi bacterium]|nr:carbohydrate deacetylase [Chloroflexota bacterium]
MPKRLIINADDYGRSPDISRGIRNAHLKGVVTSTTCMMNFPTTAEDVKIALRETPNLGMGVHLVLSLGKPISPRGKVASITDEQGNFFAYMPFLENRQRMDINEVKLEWCAQIETFVKAAGRKPTHLDSHHHFSFCSPALFEAMLALATEYGCAIRFPFSGDEIMDELKDTYLKVPSLMQQAAIRHPDVFVADFYDDHATLEELLQIINNLKDGTTEIMCHPGYVDDAFGKESIYNKQRNIEREILTSPSIKQVIQANQIELISFAGL